MDTYPIGIFTLDRRLLAMPLCLGRLTYTRILSIIIICTVAWVWLDTQNIVPKPSLVLDSRSHHKPRLPAFVVNAPCEKTRPPAKLTKLSQTLFPVSDPKKSDSWVGENHKMLQALFRCMELTNCTPNQNKVVLLGSYHFRSAFLGYNSGEEIWATSTLQALRDMGYTFLYTNNLERSVQLYHMIPDLVKAVIVEASDSFKCFKDDENCALSSQNPHGIPVWKLLSFHFWMGAEHPLGPKFTLSPEDYALQGSPPNNYLGYSVEPSCLLQSFIPHADRQHRAYVFAKWMSYVLDAKDRAWPLHFYEAAANATGIQFILGAHKGDSRGDLPPSLTNNGVLSQPAFMDAVSRTLVLVGVGSPPLSPTPYDALCLGVPFINPILDNRDDPQDITRWHVQHAMLKFLGPPFVYNVFKDDLDGFVKAIGDAMANPIDRHVLDRMRMSAVVARLRGILETDWKGEAAKVLAARKASGEGLLFTL